MMPTARQIQEMWDAYTLPPYKRNHSILVARTALWFAHTLARTNTSLRIDTRLLEAAALLHDVDKTAEKRDSEHHPDTAVRLLYEHGFDEVADVVRTHPLHAILDQKLSPSTIEQKLLYLSDKMVKHSIISVDERFALWRAESLPEEAMARLDAAYPRVKALEKDICVMAGVAPADVARLANSQDLSTMKLS